MGFKNNNDSEGRRRPPGSFAALLSKSNTVTGDESGVKAPSGDGERLPGGFVDNGDLCTDIVAAADGASGVSRAYDRISLQR